MAMDGKELVEKLAKLSQVQSIKDIPQLTHALFPGTHCPLMGAAMAVGGIKDSLIVVVGTDECTYYTKSMTIHSEKFGGIDGRCVSVVLDDHDVTFGSAEKVQEAFKEIIEEYRPQCEFLVTTCVIELVMTLTLFQKVSVSFMVFRCCRFILSILNVRTICLVWNERLLFVLK